MAGDLYLSARFDESKQYPAIVTVHPGGGVKEQTAGLYAQKLAEQGFVALAFDASCQGESEGEPRLLEDPAARVEDVRSAVDYLTTLPFVDEEKIGALGICAGGGYAVAAAPTERRIKAVATVSAVDIGAMFRGEDSAAALQTLEAVAKQRTAEAKGTDSLFLNWAPNTLEESRQAPSVLMREAYDYYRTPRAQHPNSTNRFLFRSLDKVMAFSATTLISTFLTQPLLLIAGSEADTRSYSEQFYALSNGPKELFWVEGATHIAMYDIPEYVGQAVTKLAEFFGKNL
ncbi:alpha/beta hydrolase [Brevibacillus agri]|uniref:alpha/beta hydrolase n=1 Tax=Brevibacillus agri TaxID=51101 RepID=UPI0004701C86|nr:alpha/beta hydrolase [Brevibacillus agri]MED1644465.1 alpha/beta hydrolase [Brevibacillus agri]MED1654754.1 alpha/beta hydrolase [Brevibacillus agri]MED1687484.1 alpha/beta hydrolase [Brevibacillus agri]MED1691276.1 alpha/beta hydrolase [Brevibacillus agri]MED1696825.1 alpha/beta hydrolase [Brevibacillus agri]